MTDMLTIRNSFDRFDDDLCEVVLSYLQLSDCFVLQCVSKQWKHLIFNKQNKLVISTEENRLVVNNSLLYKLNHYISEESLLKLVLLKCRFVSDLNLDCTIYANDSIMYTIIDNCQHLKSFKVYGYIEVSHKCLNRFASKFGKTLKMIKIESSYDSIELLIDLMPNLRIIRFSTVNVEISGLDCAPSINSMFITTDNKPVLPKLVEIDLSEFVYLSGFKSFVDIYCKQVKRLRVDFNELYTDLYGSSSLSRKLTQLNRFENLEKLDLDFEDYMFDESLANDFRSIGQKCVKLTELRINGLDTNLVNCFDNNFVLLRKLEINSYEYGFDSDLRISQCFKSCTHLTHLSVRCHSLVDKNFDEIGLYLTKLKYLCISGDNDGLTDNTLRRLMKVKTLCCLKVIDLYDSYSEFNSKFSDNGICDLIHNCLSINTIELGVVTTVSQRSLNAFIKRAKQFPKKLYIYSIRIAKESVESLPTNMRVKIIG